MDENKIITTLVRIIYLFVIIFNQYSMNTPIHMWILK